MELICIYGIWGHKVKVLDNLDALGHAPLPPNGGHILSNILSLASSEFFFLSICGWVYICFGISQNLSKSVARNLIKETRSYMSIKAILSCLTKSIIQTASVNIFQHCILKKKLIEKNKCKIMWGWVIMSKSDGIWE